ncbi:hypothetical protein VNO80_11088 [Phaseolus coccineus]|uniref:Uncharacterized protein n=1 Tax=Phaseolus coccineus TaxID=3886 RepID=A0AAN9NEP3_PHACN
MMQKGLASTITKTKALALTRTNVAAAITVEAANVVTAAVATADRVVVNMRSGVRRTKTKKKGSETED